MRSVELFAGGGGLALGMHRAGFSTEIVAEWDRWSCDTLRENRDAGNPMVSGIAVHEGDVRDVDWSVLPGSVDVVSGGPPCQPFSGGGLGRAADDPRDMFPATAEVIRQLQPRAFIVENVRGLTRAAFSDYYQYVQLRLSHPELIARRGEAWGEHYSRLQSEHTSTHAGLRYNLIPTLVNAANYGVPQQRWRVFLVGFRSDVDAEWSFPSQTHSRVALQTSMANGEYWERHRIGKAEKQLVERAVPRPVASRSNHDDAALQPWRTVRDAISDLGTPSAASNTRWLNHQLQPGARSYPGHTGSPLDAPAKALKAGVHGVPGGENMLRYPDDSVRYFSVRESARLQTFPDDYVLHGPWGEAMRQLGNAVPVDLAHTVAESVYVHLQRADSGLDAR